MDSETGWRRLLSMVTPEWLYEDAHYLAAEVEIDGKQAARWVPRPLKLASPATATVFTAWFPRNSFGSVYREAGVFLHVRHGRTAAIHCPWMIVDDDVALIVGRELLGYPKKLGEIELELDGDRVRGIATRRGSELLRMEGSLLERVEEAPPILGRPHRNVRAGAGALLPTLVAFTPREKPIEVRRAALELRVTSSPRDPLAELGIGRVRAAYLHRVNLGAGSLPRPCGIASPLGVWRTMLLRTH